MVLQALRPHIPCEIWSAEREMKNRTCSERLFSQSRVIRSYLEARIASDNSKEIEMKMGQITGLGCLLDVTHGSSGNVFESNTGREG